ncbi:hypothetical protein C6376_00785 [Streptomyces sp. P3]|uniref:hypothetical protein n=1 Tax=Streptomyces sp. P3 TaxID=2135430 RepID=UPI000D1B2562|nr:hypothetical protein [Streptomyces sp. P3]AVV40172.1 hypothetical protein C6376_00785 [Streptomyces sp. P3]
MSIIHALLRWILGVFAPGTGRRRAGALSAVPAARVAQKPDAGAVRRLPAARSPYGLPERLDGADTVPVRPYVLAAERVHHGGEQVREQVPEQQRTRQTPTRRRVALVLAADFGIDLDRRVIGTERAA